MGRVPVGRREYARVRWIGRSLVRESSSWLQLGYLRAPCRTRPARNPSDGGSRNLRGAIQRRGGRLGWSRECITHHHACDCDWAERVAKVEVAEGCAYDDWANGYDSSGDREKT